MIKMIPKENLEQMYLVDKMSQSEIAKITGISQATVGRYMSKYNIRIRTISESKLIGTRRLSKESLNQMYNIKKMSQLEIAIHIGVNQGTISYWMREYGMKPRTLFAGKNNPNWAGGISFDPYCEKFSTSFKDAVRERDDYICQLCGRTQEMLGRKLDVHHIHYDKENCYPDVVALCHSCNSTVNGNRDHWEQYFENQLLKRGYFCWSIKVIGDDEQ